MNNIKIFENDLPSEIDLSNEKVIGIDNEALCLVLGRDPLTLVQLGLESKQFYLIKLNRKTYEAPNLTKVLFTPVVELYQICPSYYDSNVGSEDKYFILVPVISW